MEIKTLDIEVIRQSELKSYANELYIPLHGKHTTNPEEEPFDLAEKLQSFFVFDDTNPSDPRVMLLMGDTGSGKSVFSQQLHQQLWRAYKSGDPIPLWIPLPELQNPFERAVEEVLTKYGFDDRQITEIKAKERLVFIVDSYDELHQFQNCYVTNKWEKWNAKVLMTCRSQALYYQKDPDKYFMPFNGEKRLPMLLRRLYVSPFSKEQISAYVKQYQQFNIDHKISEEDFVKIPGLMELINTPFLLHLAVEALPDILANQVADAKMTQAKLYDVFIERWFSRQVKKLSAAGLLKDTEQKIKQQFWDYCKKLAQKMHEKQVSVIPYQGQKAGGRLFGKQEQTNSWEPFFNEETEVLRSACPLRRYGEHYYGFVHASMVEYFATRAMYDEIFQGEPETMGQVQQNVIREVVDDNERNSPRHKKPPHGGIHFRVFAQEPDSIRNLADRIEMEQEFKRRMLMILEASKKNKRNAIGAANAITALVRAGVTFNGKNLSGIKISGADISGGYFDCVNFEGSDLSNVIMYNTWLRKSLMYGCNLTDIQMGEYPELRHNGHPFYVDYKSDFNGLVTAAGKTIIIWNLDSGERFKEFNINGRNITCISLSEHCNILATGSEDFIVRVWYLHSERMLLLNGHEARINCLRFSGNGEMLASGSQDKNVCIWDIVSGQVKKLQGHDDKVNCVDLSEFGTTVVSGGDDQTIRVWDIASGKAVVLHGHEKWIESVHLSKSGKIVVSGSGDNTVRVWDVMSGQAVILVGHESVVASVHLSLDEKTVVSGSWDQIVRIWDVSSRHSIVLRSHNKINYVRFSMDEKRIIAASDDQTVRTWYVNSAQSEVFHEHEKIVCAHLSAEGGAIALGNSNGTVRVLDVNNLESVVIGSHDAAVNSVHISANGKVVASGSSDQSVRIWNVVSGQSIILEGHDAAVNSVHLSADGKTVASGGSDNTVRVWDVQSGEAVILDEHENDVTSVCLSANGKLIASGSFMEDCIRVWNVASGNVKVMQLDLGAIMCVHLSADTSTVLSGDDNCEIHIFDIDSGLTKVLQGHEAKVNSVCFGVNGDVVLSGSDDRSVRIWDVVSLSQQYVFHLNARILSLSTDYKMKLMVLVLEYNIVQIWKHLVTSEQKWILLWSSNKFNMALLLNDCDVRGSIGLSPKNRELFIQRSAKVDLSSELQQQNITCPEKKHLLKTSLNLIFKLTVKIIIHNN